VETTKLLPADREYLPATRAVPARSARFDRSRLRAAAASLVEPLERRTLLSAEVTFSTTVATSVPNLVAAAGDLQTADFNADSRQDLVVGVDAGGTGGGAHPLTGTEILLSNGDGSFTRVDGPAFPTKASGASSTSSGAFAVLPLDGNAHTDLLYASQSATGKGMLTVENNAGKGSSVSFRPGLNTTINTPAAFNPQQVLAVNLHNTTSSNGVDIAQLDVAVLGLNNSGGEDLVVLSGAGDGSFTEVDDFPIQNVTEGQVLAGSFYGPDGTDLAVFDPNAGKLYTFENSQQTTGSPRRSNAISFTQGAAPLDLDTSGYAAGAVAVTGSTTNQLVVAEDPTGKGASGETSKIVPFDLGPGETPPRTTAGFGSSAGAPSGSSAGAIAVGDFDDTGNPSVIDAYGVSLADGAQLDAPTAALSVSPGNSGYGAIVAADLNGDGMIDAAAADASTHQIFAALNTTAANASLLPTSVRESVSADPYPSGGKLVSGDLAGDYGGEVQFYSGSTLLDTTALLGQQNHANFHYPSNLSPSGVSVRYLGNNVYAPSSSSPAAIGSAVLTPTLTGLKLPAAIVIGTNPKLTVPVTVTNTGTGPSSGVSMLAVYASTTPDLTSATLFVDVKANLDLKVDHGKRFNIKVGSPVLSTLPIGAYYIVAQVTDSSGNHQMVASATTFTLTAPFIDLSGSLQPVPAVLNPNKPVAVIVSVTNGGNIPAVGPLAVAFYARPAGTSGNADVLLATPAQKVKLSPHASKSLRYEFALPQTLKAGTAYTLVAVLDPANTFKETDLANNTLVGSSSFTIE